MKRTLIMLAAAATLLCSCGQSGTKPSASKFSTFSDHYLSVARQDTVSLLEAAKWMKSIGIDGIDAKVTLTDEQMAELKEAGIQPACAILDLVYSRDPVPVMEDRAIEFCKKYGFTRLMYCPKLVPADATQAQKDSIYQSVKTFAERVIAEGIDLLFEDYDNANSLTFNMEKVDVLFDMIPKANHAFDTGNYFFAGDDPMVAFNKYRKRITHVHLKDRVAVGNSQSPAVGTGVVPCLDIVHTLLAEGYDGWLTLEGYGARDMKNHLQVSIENMRK